MAKQETPRASPAEMRKRERAVIGVLRAHPNELLTLDEIWPADPYLDSLTLSQAKLAVKRLVKAGRITRVGLRYCAKPHKPNGEDVMHDDAPPSIDDLAAPTTTTKPRIVIDKDTGATFMVIAGVRYEVSIE